MGLGVCNGGARFIVWLLEGGEEWMRVLGQQEARTEVGTETEFTSLVLKEWAEVRCALEIPKHGEFLSLNEPSGWYPSSLGWWW